MPCAMEQADFAKRSSDTSRGTIRCGHFPAQNRCSLLTHVRGARSLCLCLRAVRALVVRSWVRCVVWVHAILIRIYARIQF